MSETHSVIITIVGTTEGGEAFSRELGALMDGLRALLPDAMPGFVPANPPVTVTTNELLSAPEHKRYSPLVATAEDDIIKAARMWRDKRPGAAALLRAAVDAWERFPE